jgi:hypothetical protein
MGRKEMEKSPHLSDLPGCFPRIPPVMSVVAVPVAKLCETYSTPNMPPQVDMTLSQGKPRSPLRKVEKVPGRVPTCLQRSSTEHQ